MHMKKTNALEKIITPMLALVMIVLASPAPAQIDPETGRVDLVSYTAVDDVGNLINPMIVAGQLQLAADVLRTMTAGERKLTQVFVCDQNGVPVGLIHMHMLLKAGLS